MASELVQVLSDVAEVAIDTQLAESVFKDLPIVGTAYNLAKFAVSIPDRLFRLKVIKFLQALDNTTTAQRSTFSSEITCDPNKQNRVGEIVLFSLNAADSLEKARFIGLVFAEFIIGTISEEELQSFIHSINQTFLRDLVFFIKNATPFQVKEEYARLSTTELVNLWGRVLDEIPLRETFSVPYMPSELGLKFARLFQEKI